MTGAGLDELAKELKGWDVDKELAALSEIDLDEELRGLLGELEGLDRILD